MNKLFAKFLIPTFLSIVTLTGCGKKDNALYCYYDARFDIPTNESITPNTYYSSLDFSLTGTNLMRELHRHCFDKHSKWISYDSFNGYLLPSDGRKSIDEICTFGTNGSINRTNKGEAIYTGGQYTFGDLNNRTSREHVWPCANSAGMWVHDSTSAHNVDKYGYIGGGSDLYHVRPAIKAANTARGNSKFVDFDDFPNYANGVVSYKPSGASAEMLLYGATRTGNGYEFANLYEPADCYKGDIARIIAYVYIHYADFGPGSVEGTTSESYAADVCGSLDYKAVMGYNGSQADQMIRRKLVEWNRIDPPSATEIGRNETIQKIQGNRNMFVDYPGLMEAMFKVQCIIVDAK